MLFFDAALRAYEPAGPPAESTVRNLFGYASGRFGCPLSAESSALELLRKGVFPATSLGYLQKCSRSPEVITELEGMSYPAANLEESRVNAIAGIQRNIENPLKALPLPPSRPLPPTPKAAPR